MSASTSPNVVLICVDQWRGDALSIDRHPIVHTPYLDQLATNGVRCARAYSSTPTCIAARAQLLTGLSQRNTGRVGYRDGVSWNYPVSIASEFTKNGYQTQAVGKMHVYPERNRLGFENVILHDGYLHNGRKRTRDLTMVDDYTPWLRDQLGRGDADYFEHGVNCNSMVARPWDKDEYLHPTNWVTHQSIDFLRRRDPTKPFFLFMSYHRPHPPYDPPAWAFEMYKDAPMPPAPMGDWATYHDKWRNDDSPESSVAQYDERWRRLAQAGYYGHMTHIDHQVNRFVEMLREHQLSDTVICFVSDHGELMGDHNLWRKSLPYEGSARVPLILHGPKSLGLQRGTKIDNVVELRDIMPTLLDCAGLPIPASIDGHSFLEAARGHSAPWRDHLHGEHTACDGSVHWITDGRVKYLWFSADGHEQLFDLTNDPKELIDLARQSAHASTLAHWRAILIDELNGREEGFTDGTHLIAGRPCSAVLSNVR